MLQNGGTFTDNGYRLQVNGSSTASGALWISGSSLFSGSVTSTNGFTGSLLGTASYATNALTASYVSGSGGGVGFPFSGSAIITGSLFVSSSFISGSFTGSLQGTASYASFANTASNALTASYVNQLNQPVVISGSLTVTGSTNFTGASGTTLLSSNADTLVITGSLFASGSVIITGSLSVSGSITGSLFGTASYATLALSASSAPGFTTTKYQATPAVTWSFVHNLNTRNPLLQIYDLSYNQVIPNAIIGIDAITAEIRFDYSASGYAVASNGGGLLVTGSMSQLNQTSAAVTWSFAHNLNTKYPTFEVYDDNDLVVIPAGIRAIDNNSAELYFAFAATGKAIANFSGINGAPNATTASYAATASVLNPVTNSFIILSNVSSSLNFVDDTAAASGGVPLGGLYRNGNFILIRLT
jgi:hypothetical protein